MLVKPLKQKLCPDDRHDVTIGVLQNLYCSIVRLDETSISPHFATINSLSKLSEVLDKNIYWKVFSLCLTRIIEFKNSLLIKCCARTRLIFHDNRSGNKILPAVSCFGMNFVVLEHFPVT